ncbi:MAG: aldehyde dehydrogenase family protein [Myxococcota bacterium]
MAEFEVRAAYDQALITTLRRHTREESFAALAECHALYENREGWIPKAERIAVLERAAALVEAREEDLATQAAREGGKPYMDSLVEVRRGIQGIRAAVHELHGFGGREIPMSLTKSSEGRMAYTFRDPRGVVMAISAFNHPFNLIIHQVIPAFAVGCPVLVKPATTTPLSCKALIDILHEAGAPKAWCRMLLCDNDTASELVADSRTAFLSFIGSARVGWMLRSKLGPGAACALEHGGVAPAIVDETANLDDAIPLLTKGGFYHAGQVCVSVQRIYVHASIADQFTERFVAAAKALKVGDPVEEDTEVGPLILPKEVDRVAEWVKEAVDGGAKLLCGGEKLSDTTYAPTVLREPPEDAKVSQQEVFGPVVSIYPYTDLDDAIARANKPDAYFQASIFTQNLERAMKVHRHLHGMAIMVNDHTAFLVDWMPFGGHKSSGLNAGGIGFSMHDMTLERMVVFRSPSL